MRRLRPLFHSLVTVTVPVMTGDEKIGSLSIVVKKRRRVERSIGDFLEELAKMFSTQLGVYNVEYQKKLRKKAEFKALQSQVNPHFLYNALNTISCICDEDAGKASDLILTLASYYRQTLENDQYMLDIDTEINHVRTYLEIEKARFEEKLRVEINVEDGLSCQVRLLSCSPSWRMLSGMETAQTGCAEWRSRQNGCRAEPGRSWCGSGSETMEKVLNRKRQRGS